MNNTNSSSKNNVAILAAALLTLGAIVAQAMLTDPASQLVMFG
jgi:hypothetical protein